MPDLGLLVRVVVLAESALLAGFALSVVVMAWLLARAGVYEKLPIYVWAIAGSGATYVLGGAFWVVGRMELSAPFVWYGTPLVGLAAALGIWGTLNLLDTTAQMLRRRVEGHAGVVTHAECGRLHAAQESVWAKFERRLEMLESDDPPTHDGQREVPVR